MSKIKAVLLNGPPQAGKDTGAEFLYQIVSENPAFKSYTPHKIKFATPLKEMTHEFYNVPHFDEFHFEGNKEEPQECFLGRSAREAYIYVDSVLKKRFGDDYLGHLMVDRMLEQSKQITGDIFFCSDCGFNAEVQPLIDEFGHGDIMIVRLYKKGHTFKGDSRSYVDVPQIPIQVIENVHNKQNAYRGDLENVIRSWIYC